MNDNIKNTWQAANDPNIYVVFYGKYGKWGRFFLLMLNSWFFSNGIFLFLRHCPKCLFFLGKKKEGNKLSVLVRLCDAICFLLINEKAYAAVADIVCGGIGVKLWWSFKKGPFMVQFERWYG